MESFFNVLSVFPLYVVVSPDKMEPFFFVEFAHQPKCMAVCSPYNCKPFVFPKLIHISDFNVSESLVVVVIQCMEEENLIMSKVISPTIITSVTIAKENEFRELVKGNFLG
jgi:hypothetical protein